MYARFSPVSLSGLVETAADTFTATALGVGGATSTAYPLNVTGSGHISGSLTVDGSMNVAGTTTTTNTAVVVSEQMNITNTGTGPALQVTQQGAQPVATFVDGEGGMAMKIWDNGLISLNSSVQPANQLEVSGNVKILGTGSFIGNLSGNATTASSATTAAACTGNSATATTAAACTGNSATATTAAACTGNSATATTAAACTGNSATATTAAACTGNAATVTTLTSTQIVSALGATPLYAVPATVSTSTNFTGGLQSGGLTVLNTGSSVNYSQLVNFPVNTNNYWAANSTNVWLANAGNVGIGTSSPVSPLTVFGTVSYAGIGTASSPLTLCTTSGSSRLYLGTGYTAATGAAGYIQSSDYYASAEHPITLALNPNGGYVGIGTTAPTVELDVNGSAQVSGTLTAGGSAVMTSSYDFFTNADAPVATTGTWAYNSTNIDSWINHIYKINPTSGTLENGSGNAATADFNVPTGANTMFIQHLAYSDALYYDVLGSSDNTNFYLLKRVSNYINHTNQVELIESVNIGGQNIPYTRVRIQTYANSGDCRIAGIAWRASLQPGGNGLVHTSQLNGVQFGTLTVPSATYYTGQATATLTFPTAFASVPTVTCTPAFNLTGVWQIFLGINSVSTTGVTFGINNSGGTASSAVIVTIHWMAMA